MKLVLVPLALLFLAGIFWFRKRGAVVKNNPARSGTVRVVIIVKDQEPWVEGFIRKLFWRIRNLPGLEVVVVDKGSRDGTREILDRLRRKYPFHLLAANEGGDHETLAGTAEAASGFADARCFDVRGLKGKELLRAPLFCHLSQDTAGISRVLSK